MRSYAYSYIKANDKLISVPDTEITTHTSDDANIHHDIAGAGGSCSNQLNFEGFFYSMHYALFQLFAISKLLLY